ncbi:MAG: tetratricopeptide repeat protein [Sandaracinaceae bacterium]|nr:tetratricopeptide repeat protein [Sandaracinaceae bacterium]
MTLRGIKWEQVLGFVALLEVFASLAWAQENDKGGALASGIGESQGDSSAPSQPQGSQPQGDVPWSQTRDVAQPAFLELAGRRVQGDRPPPSPEQVTALVELEKEVSRFSKAGNAYRASVVSILRREYERRRRERGQGYARQIKEEERLQAEALNKAIELFERFIQRYPSDPTYTPDAMFRLGELYYERSAIQFAELSSRDSGTVSQPNYMPTIEVYRELIRRFPNYRQIDGVYYLIGYCLNEMGQMEEALLAWLNLVCANRYRYEGRLPSEVEEREEGGKDRPLGSHPSLEIGSKKGVSSSQEVFVDPYADCRPISETAGFVSETWLRIGEYHFDNDPRPYAIERAISAYSKVLVDPQDRNYNLALYKVAWAYYRATKHYPESIAHFVQLVDWSDREKERTGKAGSELRAEAIQYLGIIFAYDDWNDNNIPDVQERLPSPIQRLQDPSLLPQDRPWTPEVYFQTGQVFFDQAQYELAIQVWELTINKFPYYHKNPEIAAQIAKAYRRLGRREDELRVSEMFTRFLPGTEWYDRNADHPREQRRAEELAEGMLIQQATYHHEQAQILRRRAVQNKDEAMLNQAIAEYNLAADLYRRYIQLYPNRPDAYELQYALADCYFWSEQYEKAAEAYAAVRDSNLDNRHLSQAARLVVESLVRLLNAAQAKGEVQVRTEPPSPSGNPPRVTPIPLPDLLNRIAMAREIYLQRVDEKADTERVRPAYEFNNAIYLYLYGYWPQARERFWRIYQERCKGPKASKEGEIAYRNLRNMAAQLGDSEEVVRLAKDIEARGCTFSPSDEPVQRDKAYCREHPDDVRCQAARDITDARFRDAINRYREAQEGTPEGELCPPRVDERKRTLFEESSAMLIDAVNDTPEHPQAPTALMYAAVALECAGRNESAMQIYERIIEEIGARRPSDSEEQERLTSILAQAYFRLAYSANRNFDYETAIRNYRVLADDRRFSAPAFAERRADALVNAARIFEFQQNYVQAAEYYRRAGDAAQDPETKRLAHYRAAEMAYKRRDWAGAIREMQAFIERYRNDNAAGELLVTAAWRIAEARRELRQEREYRDALQNVINIFQRSGQPPGSIAAGYAAQAHLLLTSDGVAQLENTVKIAPGRQPTINAFVQALRRQIDDQSQKVQKVIAALEPALAYRRPESTVAVYALQGRAYEFLARGIAEANLTPLPDELQRQIRRAGADVRAEIEAQFQATIQQFLESQIRPVECFAIVRYALAARLARQAGIGGEHAQTAVSRIQSYGEERVAECMNQQHSSDSSFAPYQEGEFSRSRPGRIPSVEIGFAASPSLVSGGR